ncbi:hypothetical protein CHLNCDRAFT_135929 [Chlorella variabilis]|uniref:Uncharacterized protein n=1 Tax=Chlorella variabilis TaxID=554065 RepID=E1ZJE2_CHLVA|nr:hypothetical protein CHLNCDRAFT_135929 [Chlorella variabilis]EFN53844.1 hypothetical protein CHLNCDRAFT_135929 [Chlorella variabilis]|eukprot:XP_005845946.1 hypothetical protein CHLNCDRAFT_135929 [Chlorella variabilis]
MAAPLFAAAEAGDEAEVRRLLAAGARADQAADQAVASEVADSVRWLPLHVASSSGHEGVVKLLLEAAPATALVADSQGRTALHLAARSWNVPSWWPPAATVAVVRLLLSAAPAAAAMLDVNKQAPIHHAASRSNTAAVQLLLEAAPELAFAPHAFGETPLQLALGHGYQHTPEHYVETARCLVRAAPAVQPSLDILLHAVAAS